MEQTNCKFCGQAVFTNYYFCPYCGKKIVEPPITALKEISVYLLSVFLPPLGLWPGIKYLSQKNEKAKRVGLIAIILTIISTIVTIWISIGLLGSLTQSLNAQMNQYPGLGL
jgi:uncharacterized membrane protein YqaE (UPF0057 family)